MSRRARPTLRSVLVAVNLAGLAVPLGGVFLLRLYESALIRRAESELIGQGAVIAAVYRAELGRELGAEADGYGRDARRWRPAPPGNREPDSGERRLHPLPASLDLTQDPVLPPPPEAVAPPTAADPRAVAAGVRLSGVLEEAQRTTLAGVRVVDWQGTVVASSRGELGMSLRNRGEILGAVRGAQVSVLRERISDGPVPPLDSLSRTGGLRVFVSLPVVSGERVWGAVVLSRTPMGIVQSLHGIRGYLLAGLALLLLLLALVSVFVSLTVSRPIRELVRRTERVAGGERAAAVVLERPGTEELAVLSAAVERMARALERRADYIGGFAASVSHEFKTPLAAMRGAVELLREHGAGMTPAERERFLGNLQEDVERLDRLVRGLLDLARAEAAGPPGGIAGVATALAAVTARFEGGSETAITVAVAAGTPPARVAPEVLEAVVGNLVENALRHGGAGVRVRIDAGPEIREGRPGVVIRVADDGRGIAKADQARAFEPFFTTARATGGTGLGLAVVRALVEARQGTVRLVRSRPGETVLEVWLGAG